MPSLEECYGVLGVAAYAAKPEVSQAYKLLIHVWHPDRFEHQPRIRAQAEEQLKRITSAYQQIQAAGFPEIAGGTASRDRGRRSRSDAAAPSVARCPWCGVQNRLPRGYASEDLTCGGCRRGFRLDLWGEPVKVVEGREERAHARGDGSARPGLLVPCPWCSMSNWRLREETLRCTACGRSFRLGRHGEPVKNDTPE